MNSTMFSFTTTFDTPLGYVFTAYKEPDGGWLIQCYKDGKCIELDERIPHTLMLEALYCGKFIEMKDRIIIGY